MWTFLSLQDTPDDTTFFLQTYARLRLVDLFKSFETSITFLIPKIYFYSNNILITSLDIIPRNV